MFNWNKERLKEFFKTKAAYILLAIFVAASATLAIWRYNNQPQDHTDHHGQYADTFFVTAAEFDYASGVQAIHINFSQPVDPTAIADYFTLTPNIKGRFEKGPDINGTDTHYIPDYPFESGLDYTVTLKTGLKSKIGGELSEDYVKILSLRFSADDFKILKNDRYALLQSVSFYEDMGLRAQIGSNIKKPSIKIFKASDPEIALRDIISYTAPAYGYQQPAFHTDTAKLTKLEAPNDIKHNDKINLPKETGIYLVQAINDGQIKSQTWITVNTMGIHFRQDDRKFIVATQDLRSGEPLLNVELKTYDVNENKELTFLQKLQLNGLGSFPLQYPNRISVLTAKKGNEFAIVPVAIDGSLAEINVYQNLSSSWQGFLYTDRPIYKTTDTVKLRGIVRQDNDGIYTIPEQGRKVILRGNGNTTPQSLPEISLPINDHGVLFGEIPLKNLPAGNYSIYGEMEGKANDGYLAGMNASFEIKDYTKPDFELKTQIDKEEATEGDKINITLSGSRFDGKTFGKQTVSYTVYGMDFYETEKSVYNKAFDLNGWGGMCGGGDGFDENYYGEPIEETKEVSLNNAGQLALSFDTRKLARNVSQQVTFVVEKTDKNGNTITDAKTAIVHNGEINIFLRSFKNQSKSAVAPTAVFSAETQNGGKLKNQSFDYVIDQIKYDSNGKPQATPLASGKVQTNGDGVGEFKVTGLDKLKDESDTIEVSVRKKDNHGNLVTGSQTLYAYGNSYQLERPVLLDVSASQLNLVPGEVSKLKIIAPGAMKVLVAFERGRIYDQQWLDLKAGENTYEFVVKDTYMPSITPTFTAFYKNRYYSEGLSFNVPAMKKLVNINVTTDKQVYSAGQVAKISIKITDNEGRPVQTDLSLGIIDKAIFALRKSTQLPLHSSFYFFRDRRTNNSSSMTGISFGEGSERGGGGGNETSFSAKDVDVLYWNPELKTNSSGELTVFVNVVGTTAWKGVIYAANDQTLLGQTDFEFSSR